jgi:histidinol phosphatase-like PHP family hydrolase
MNNMLYDLHTHTFLSDGELSPIELIRRAAVAGYTAIALTDHAGPGTMERCIAAVARDCELARQHWPIIALPGIELTHCPPESIPALARQAREARARVVVVHGETIVEPVPPGTNLAAACPEVDLLAHPGLLSHEAAEKLAASNVLVEITSRRGHSLTNGLVAVVARQAGCKMVVNSDTHSPSDLLSPEFARRVAAGAGLSAEEQERALKANPEALLARLGLT